MILFKILLSINGIKKPELTFQVLELRKLKCQLKKVSY